MVKPGPVLLGDVVVRDHFTDVVQDSPGVQLAAQLDQRLCQAVMDSTPSGNDCKIALLTPVFAPQVWIGDQNGVINTWDLQ